MSNLSGGRVPKLIKTDAWIYRTGSHTKKMIATLDANGIGFAVEALRSCILVMRHTAFPTYQSSFCCIEDLKRILDVLSHGQSTTTPEVENTSGQLKR